MAKKEKKPVHHVVMTEGKRQIIQQLLQEYDIETAEDIQEALKDLLGGTIKGMMEAEMDDHLGYEKSERADRGEVTNYRNGTKKKLINSRYGSLEIDVPQDRESTFEPQVVKKRQKDISSIDQKIISKGFSASRFPAHRPHRRKRSILRKQPPAPCSWRWICLHSGRPELSPSPAAGPGTPCRHPANDPGNRH